MGTRMNAASTPQSQEGYLPLLRRAALDDQFRAELEANPQEALARYGIAIDPSMIPDQIALPEKGALTEALSAAEANPDDIFNPIFIEAHMGFLHIDTSRVN